VCYGRLAPASHPISPRKPPRRVIGIREGAAVVVESAVEWRAVDRCLVEADSLVEVNGAVDRSGKET